MSKRTTRARVPGRTDRPVCPRCGQADDPGSECRRCRHRPGRFVIPARTCSDDHAVEVGFDARAWFEQALDEEVLALAVCGWGGDYPADAVAEYFGRGATQELFDYLECEAERGIDDPVGFECRVDAAAARHWLLWRRPDVARKLGDLRPERAPQRITSDL